MVPMLEQNALIHIGYCGKTHGLKGFFYINKYTATEFPYTHVFIDEVRYDVDKFFIQKQQVLLCLHGVTGKEQAETLHRKSIFIHRSQCPEEVVVWDIVGCAIHFVPEQYIGTVLNIHNFGSGDVLEVSLHSSTFYYPYREPFIVSKDLANKTIIAQYLPEFLTN
jgi:16S rRNA processing protein RimM